MASVPLLGQQPQIQSPLSIQGMLNQVRLQQQSLQQQQAMAPIIQQQAQQQLQQQQVQTQLAQQDLKDRQLLTEGLQQSGGDYMKALDYATQNGASGNFALNARVQYANAVAATAKATSDQLNAHQTQLNMLDTAMGAVLDAPPEEKDAEFGRQINQLKMGGVPAAMLPGSRPTDQQLTQMRNSNAVALGILKDAQTAQKTATDIKQQQSADLANEVRNYSGLLANTQNDSAWQAIYNQAPENVQEQLEAHYSPEAATRAAHAALTPEQQQGMTAAAQTSRAINIQQRMNMHQPVTPEDAAWFRAYTANQERNVILRNTLQRQPYDIFGGGGVPAFPGAPVVPAANQGAPAAPTGQLTRGATNLPATPVPGAAAPTAPASAPVQPGAPAIPASATQTADNNPKVIQGASPTDPGNWAKIVDSYRDPATGRPISPQYRGILLQQLNYLGKPLPLGRPNSPNYAISNLVQTIDPTHDDTVFPARNTIIQQYTKSATDGQLSATNTALGHLGELYEAAKLLDGSNLPALHALQAKWGLATGDDAAATYRYIAGKVGDELTSAYVKGGGGEKDRAADQSSFDLSRGQQQIISTIGSATQLLNSKIASDRNNWQQTYRPQRPEDQFDNRWLTPEARQTVATLSQLAPTNKAAQSIGHKVGDIVTQKGHNFKVTAVDANGKVTNATAQ